jgi:hypothetical protein
VWPDLSKPGEAQFVLRDEREMKLWDLLEQSGLSAYGELATMESRSRKPFIGSKSLRVWRTAELCSGES